MLVLKIYRDIFDKLINNFKFHSALLTAIKQEYDQVLELLIKHADDLLPTRVSYCK